MKKLLFLFGLLPLLAFGGATSGGGAGGGSGTITGVTGTSGNILVNGGTTPVTSGSVTLTLPTALTSINSITAVASTDLNLNAGSGSNNVNITPSGTGLIRSSVNSNNVSGISLTNSNSGTGAQTRFVLNNDASNIATFGILSSGFTTANAFVAGYGFFYTTGLGLAIVSGNASGPITFSSGGTSEIARFSSAGHLLLGTPTDGSTGIIQLVASTNATAGIAWGSDTKLYRGQAGGLYMVSTTTTAQFRLTDSTTNSSIVQVTSGVLTVETLGGTSLLLGTNSTTAVTISSAQAVTLANSITTGAGLTAGAVPAFHGGVRTSTALVVSTTQGIQEERNGVLYTLAVLTTNP